jgi:hypothetical protein
MHEAWSRFHHGPSMGLNPGGLGERGAARRTDVNVSPISSINRYASLNIL